MSEPVVGKALDRVDARRKVTGRATYAAEVPVTGVAHAVIVGSTIARGRITKLELQAARTSPGVLAVLTHADAMRLPKVNVKAATNARIVQVLQDDVIRYSDQPIAVVVAETLEAAQHAALSIRATYDADEPVAAIDQRLKSATEPETVGPRAKPKSNRGNADAALASAAITVDATYRTPVEHHNPMEPHATIAVWSGSDRLTVYDSTQGIFGVRDRLANVFGLDKKNVRVINQFVGGGFGCKGAPWSHVFLATMAAKQLGRPVKLVLTRTQMFALVGHRAETIQHIQLGAGKDGKLTAIKHEVTTGSSQFDDFVEPAAVPTRHMYACDNVSTNHLVIRIDAPTPTFTRGPGEASGMFAIESAMDELAYAVGIDPMELRLRNYAERDQDANKPFSSKSLRECYRAGAAKFGWAKRSPKPRSMRAGDALVGWGMASATYPARQLPASARAKLLADGTLLVQAGTQDIGPGTYTIMTQLAADELALPVEAVKFELGDTTFPETPLSAGSFTTSSTGPAVALTARKLRDAVIELAIADARSPLYGVKAADVRADDRGLTNAGRRDLYTAILQRAGKQELEVEHKVTPNPEQQKYSIHSFGAVFVEVHVDELLSQVRCTRIVGAFGCGRILNPKTAASNLMGGIVWSIGMALEEHTVRDPRTARNVTRDLVDYHVPVHADVPPIEIITVDEKDAWVNEIGAKGLGEVGNCGASAAIANAVFHATGIRIRDLPITIDKLLKK
jgi:xanthine dehydrogenase YagR molybdenum-binding subunit